MQFLRWATFIAIVTAGAAGLALLVIDHIGSQEPSGPVVTHVWDGDTLDVTYEGETQTVRLIGIDSPEKDDCGYDSSRAALEDLVLDQEVVLKHDVERFDDYDRALAYVYVDDTHVNEQLAVNGHVRYYEFPPNTKYADRFQQLVYRAIDARRGLWAECDDALEWATQ